MSDNPSNDFGPRGPQYNQQPGQYPPPGYGQEPPKKKGKKKWAIGCLGLFFLVIVLFAGCSALLSGGADDSVPTPNETTSTPSAESTEDAPATEEAPETTEPEAEAPEAEENAEGSSLTASQRNAVAKAEDYLGSMAFSRTGLIEQLEFEGFSNADATFAVDSLDTDYQVQAGKKAQEYVESMAFSRTGLIEQLGFEGFTPEHSTAAVDSMTIDYNEQAAKKAQEYLDSSSFSRAGLIDQLTFEGFTAEQATYGVDQTGL
ncbi:Ltp family lipoprotein [Kocuria rosea]|uniref:Ltp family lipoprotein n=1 Tax=Kocuria rosea TaxID=1275 RepID=UPI0025423AF2|nr:Ltp family lipoprotein [Kocuria rosea]WIG16653.1 Ltp family lipoprotein [Kocuria rosea]